MGANCAPLVADSFPFCYERDIMLSLSDNNQTCNFTSKYLDDLLNIDKSKKVFFDSSSLSCSLVYSV